MAGKAVAVLGIMLAVVVAVAAARGGPLMEDTNPWNVLDTTIEFGKPSSAAVNIVLVRAIVTARFLGGNGKNTANVFGVLGARIGVSPPLTVLFQRSSAEPVSVKAGGLIPLAKPVVSYVPLNSFITIWANLLDFKSKTANEQIALGSAQFPAKLSGSDQQIITGTHGEILVKVRWIDIA